MPPNLGLAYLIFVKKKLRVNETQQKHRANVIDLKTKEFQKSEIQIKFEMHPPNEFCENEVKLDFNLREISQFDSFTSGSNLFQ